MLNLFLTVATVLAVACPGHSLKGPSVGFPMMNEMSGGTAGDRTTSDQVLVFATYAETDEQIAHVQILAESIREFAGRYNDAAVWLYLPREHYTPSDENLVEKLTALGVEIRKSDLPKEALRFFYAGKLFAATEAEAAATEQSAMLVWLDEDTVILQEPTDFVLPPNTCFAYRPVMHNRSGSLFDEPPNEFWALIYERLEIADELLFPMITPADKQKIRAYFNAGLLVVRPKKGILRTWAESFKNLYEDKILVNSVMKDVEKRIFLHQTALVSAVKFLKRNEMMELPDSYNYPMFFKVMYGGLNDFDAIDDVVTLRYDAYFRNPDPQWAEKVRGPDRKITWLKARLGK
jgi:hypothetical protein